MCLISCEICIKYVHKYEPYLVKNMDIFRDNLREICTNKHDKYEPYLYIFFMHICTYMEAKKYVLIYVQICILQNTHLYIFFYPYM